MNLIRIFKFNVNRFMFRVNTCVFYWWNNGNIIVCRIQIGYKELEKIDLQICSKTPRHW